MIEVNNLTKRFGLKQVLNGVSFTAKKGEITALVGVNGAGKTTIMNAVMGLIPVNSGKIKIFEEKLTKHTYDRVAFVPDEMTMLPQMRIVDAMQFMKDHYKLWSDQRAEELLAFFKLNKLDRIASLSKGNATKVNLLLGLALDVDFLLLDEPFSGIDIFSREQIADVFTTHLIEDRGVIITTHEIKEIEHLLDEVILLDDGKIAKQFNAEEMRETEGKSVVDVMREVFQA